MFNTNVAESEMNKWRSKGKDCPLCHHALSNSYRVLFS